MKQGEWLVIDRYDCGEIHECATCEEAEAKAQAVLRYYHDEEVWHEGADEILIAKVTHCVVQQAAPPEIVQQLLAKGVEGAALAVTYVLQPSGRRGATDGLV